jgi:co-chaperonin GroES (HSP10)
MSLNFDAITESILPIRNRVLVRDMHFGEQKTRSGLIIRNDDGTTRGIYPRWAKIYAKGPENTEPYQVGHWVLIEHGRWTRSVKVSHNGEEFEVRMAEPESILGYSESKPVDIFFGQEH